MLTVPRFLYYIPGSSLILVLPNGKSFRFTSTHAKNFSQYSGPQYLHLTPCATVTVLSPMHFAVWALCVSNVLPLVRSFTTSHPRIMRVSCVRGRSGLRPRSRISAGARQPLRLTPDEKVEGANVADKAVSDFGQTSGPVKAFVSGLTDMFVTLSGEDKEAYSDKKSGIIRKVWSILNKWPIKIESFLPPRHCSVLPGTYLNLPRLPWSTT